MNIIIIRFACMVALILTLTACTEEKSLNKSEKDSDSTAESTKEKHSTVVSVAPSKPTDTPPAAPPASDSNKSAEPKEEIETPITRDAARRDALSKFKQSRQQ
ncbi:hypothetical protein FEM03_05825 [Phragmitibacter flavus]|uniref:Uncharacterized protein n=1 Tax=Phragmitibacter flavus TaxID=2576071 RepID=A0A5R8KH70_9BACT|nr:hypothetical protein [Phragmitibacter flavus]TLD71656.1 hypothetical protein FEM03_05825 [Phragmitibacter flavus]